MRTLQKYVDHIEECGGLPYSILKPILRCARPSSLMQIEDYNPQLLPEETGELWARFVGRHLPRSRASGMERLGIPF